MLCDTAVIVGAKLYVIGAGLAYWSANDFPASVDLTLSMVLETEIEISATGQLDVLVVDRQANTLLAGQFAVTVNPPLVDDAPAVLPVVAPVNFVVSEPGRVEVLVSIGGSVEARLPLAVTLA